MRASRAISESEYVSMRPERLKDSRQNINWIGWCTGRNFNMYAIAREKQVKRWTRVKKVQLVVSVNPTWRDLAADWFPELKGD
jgi:hypothetical protein